jgi:hypothetical protein
MLLKEIIAAYSEKHKKNLQLQNTALRIITIAGMYNYR